MLKLPPPKVSHPSKFVIFQEELFLQQIYLLLVFVIIDHLELLSDFQILYYFCSVPNFIIHPEDIDECVQQAIRVIFGQHMCSLKGLLKLFRRLKLNVGAWELASRIIVLYLFFIHWVLIIHDVLFSFKMFFIAVGWHLHLFLVMQVKIFSCSRANLFFIYIVAWRCLKDSSHLE